MSVDSARIDTARLLDTVDISRVVGAYVKLEEAGQEFRCLCPFHRDHNPSMSVIPNRQFAYCFVCGKSWNAIDFVMDIESVDFLEACSTLKGERWEKPKTFRHEKIAKDAKSDRIAIAPPPDTPPPTFYWQSMGGDPVQIFELKDLSGQILAYETRYQVPSQRKEPRMWTYGAQAGKAPQWDMRVWTGSPRPLFGLEHLQANKASQVCITEGPKKSLAVRALLPMYASVSWTGGVNGWKKHNWEVLRGRDGVLIWPDSDEVGISEGMALARFLADPKGLALKVKVIDSSGEADGWDAADALAEGWSTLNVKEWAKTRLVIIKPEELTPEPELVSEPLVPTQKPEPRPERAKGKPRLAAVEGNVVAKPEIDDLDIPPSLSQPHLAQEWIKAFGKDWRYVKAWSRWYKYNGNLWREDPDGEIDGEFLLWVVRAANWRAASELSSAQKRAISSRTSAWMVRGIVEVLQPVRSTREQWDSNQWALGTPGGTVDLKTGKIHAGRREEHITMSTTVAPVFQPSKPWEAFLDSIHPGRPDMIAFLKRYAGYWLTGSIAEETLLFCIGEGQNGKGTFIKAISDVMGDYALRINESTLMVQNNATHTSEIAVMRNKRLVYVDETKTGSVWDEGRIKEMTGGSKITACLKFRDNEEFVPTMKLAVIGNVKPRITNGGASIERRLHTARFPVRFSMQERDNSLKQRMEAEYPKILAWMIEGCLEWQAIGLQPPADVLEATRSYLESSDVLGEWIEECTTNGGSMVPGEAYHSYSAWVRDREEDKKWSRQYFLTKLDERGYPYKKENGLRAVHGLSLKKKDEHWYDD